MIRKIMMPAAAVCCVFASMLLCACDKDDNKTEIVEEEDNTPAAVAIVFHFETSQDILNYGFEVISYDDGTGIKKDTVTTTSWSKTLLGPLPSSFTFIREVVLKEDVDLTNVERIHVCKKYSYTYGLYNAKGKKVYTDSYSFSPSDTGIPKERIEEYFAQNRANQEKTISFNEKGEVVKAQANAQAE